MELLPAPVSERDPHAAVGYAPDFPHTPVRLAEHADELDPLTRELRFLLFRAAHGKKPTLNFLPELRPAS